MDYNLITLYTNRQKSTCEKGRFTSETLLLPKQHEECDRVSGLRMQRNSMRAFISLCTSDPNRLRIYDQPLHLSHRMGLVCLPNQSTVRLLLLSVSSPAVVRVSTLKSGKEFHLQSLPKNNTSIVSLFVPEIDKVYVSHY